MRTTVTPRWHDWVIGVALLALTGLGVYALWGESLRALVGADAPEMKTTSPR